MNWNGRAVRSWLGVFPIADSPPANAAKSNSGNKSAGIQSGGS